MTCTLNMKPASYQSMPSSMEGGHQMMALNRGLKNAYMMYCDKCGFSTADEALFRRHVNEHNGKKFHCPYCSKVLFTELELSSHLTEHSKYKFNCPHCGQGYMRWLCLVKHIDRLHSKDIDKQVPSEPGRPIPCPTDVSVVSMAPQSAQKAVTRGQKKSPPTTPSVCVNRRKQPPRTLEINLQNTKGAIQVCANPQNGNTHNNTALTVSLPDEVTIPAGCKVELLEVKTVNGTKELKLRLVSRQESNSVVHDARTTVERINHPNLNEPIDLCAVEKRFQAKMLNAKHPHVINVDIPNVITNQADGVKATNKRTGNESTAYKWHQYSPKRSRLTLNTESEHNVTQKQHCDNNAKNLVPILPAPTTVDSYSQLVYLLNSEPCATSQKTTSNGVYINLGHSSTTQLATETNAKSSATLKVEPGQVCPNGSAASIKKGKAAPSPGTKPFSRNASSTPMRVLAMKQQESIVSPSQPKKRQKTLPNILKKPQDPPHAHREGWSQEQEGFPVISSVFSLSQQPQEHQGPIQPLMMALRGIIMDKTPVTNGDHKADNETKSQDCALDPLERKPVIPIVNHGNDSVKVETDEKNIEVVNLADRTSFQVKEEKTTLSTAENSSGNNDLGTQIDDAPQSNCSTERNVANTDTPDSNPCLPKYLKVSLTRVDEDVQEETLTVPKLKISRHKIRVQGLNDCTVLYTMPLKGDQLVKRPGPNQPVVVLNHPKPRAPVQERTATLLDLEEPLPRCQILKMKLSKVIGQKYEVMGCTVRVCP